MEQWVPFHQVKDPWLYYETNVVGTKNVIDFAECDHFVYCSIGSAFDPAPHATTKYGGELLTKQFKENLATETDFTTCVVTTDLINLTQIFPHPIRKVPAVANGKFDTLEILGTDYDTAMELVLGIIIHVVDIVDSFTKGCRK